MKRKKVVYRMPKAGEMPPLGSGERFKAIEEKAKASGARNPAAVAASIGMKKYGKARMQKMAQAGRKKKK